ncbi:hypothetical protein D3C85_937770 [compost metagenome]
MIRKKCSRKKKAIQLTIVHKTSSSCLSLNKGNVSRPKQKKPRFRRSMMRITDLVPPSTRNKPTVMPCPPPARPCPPPKHHHYHPLPSQAQLTTINKECCGNILLQGNQPGFRIWEMDVDSRIEVAQISIFSNASSTQALEVDIETNEVDNKRLSIPPGSTINFIGQCVKAITVSSLGDEMGYVEGKYVISTTLQIQSEHHCCDPE